MRATLTVTTLLTLTLVSCAHPTRRYQMKPPLWNDSDRNHVEVRPASRYSGMWADGADQIALRPLSRAFTLPVADEALNVNSLDEVPDSAWFTNRIGLGPVSAEDITRGACSEGPALDPARGPWLVSTAKPDGANPGFFVTAPDGVRYLLKFDGAVQPQRATSADVVGSKLYHAFGYHTPCNEVVFFAPDILQIAPGATRTNEYGEKVPIARQDIDTVVAAGFRTRDGLVRASASRFLPGKPLGPFRYEGTRSDDPNDVVAHERRRELRGGRLLAAWTNHFDSREQNTLDVWVQDGGRSYIRHYYIDWGDSFGSIWESSQITRRLGHSGYLDFDHLLGDLLTLGTLQRPWHTAAMAPDAGIFGYFDDRQFVASRWRGGYGNPSFDRMSDRDALWAVRILARIGDDEVRSAVAAGRLPEPSASRLTKILIARRDRILREYLTRLSPLTRFVALGASDGAPTESLCFEDDALRTGVADPASTTYRMRMLAGKKLDQVLSTMQLQPDPRQPHRSCLTLLPAGGQRPERLAGPGAPDDDPLRYGVVEILTEQQHKVASARASVRIHLYDLGPARGFRLVGIERSPVER